MSRRCWKRFTDMSHVRSCMLKFSWCNFRCYVLNAPRSFSVWPLLLCTWCFSVPSSYKWRGFYCAEQGSYSSLLVLSKKHSCMIHMIVIKNGVTICVLYQCEFVVSETNSPNISFCCHMTAHSNCNVIHVSVCELTWNFLQAICTEMNRMSAGSVSASSTPWLAQYANFSLLCVVL